MTTGPIDNFILNGPFEEPSRHWRFDAEGITDEVVEGRRPSAYFMPIPASKRKKAAQQEIVFQEWSEDRIEETRFVNELRDEVTRWRETGWHGATHTSKALLRHWTDPGRARRLYFAQLEAVETAIWLAEVAPDTGKGRYFLNELTRFGEDANPGLFRVAHKMATGTGKTVVAGMLIAWQTLNKAANPTSKKHSDAFLLVGPGLTIKDRLRVLMPSDPGNYYTAFDLVPAELRPQLGRAKVVVTNFQSFRRKEKVKVAKATKDLLRQDGDRFTLATLGRPLRSDDPDSMRAVVLMIGDPRYQSVWSRLPESVTTGEAQAEAVHGVSLWGLLDRDSDYAATFNEAMSRLTALDWPTVAAAYDFTPFRRIVDVGGGHGQLLASMLAVAPGAEGVLLEQESLLPGAKERLGEAGVLARCRLEGGSFFDRVPKDGNLYVVRRVLHDFDDDRALALLGTLRRDMPDDARLLLLESVVPPGRRPRLRQDPRPRHAALRGWPRAHRARVRGPAGPRRVRADTRGADHLADLARRGQAGAGVGVRPHM